MMNMLGGGAPVRQQPHLVKLPFVPTEVSSEEERENESKQRTLGHVDQGKLVDILRKFTLPFMGGEDSDDSIPFKRYNIPRHQSYHHNQRRNKVYYNQPRYYNNYYRYY